MNYPVWDPGISHGVVIAVVAILHVFVSHFAVGGGFYLVLTEHLARRRDDAALLDYLVRHSRFFILLTLVFGAISGVGIWFTIGLINPAGTSALIHAFVWGWAIEWVFFLVEIAAALIYYYGWERLPARRHLAVGWIYFGAAWLSMVIINGILSFQMTPGRWLETRDFWDGFFNPTYWPSLATRTLFSVGLAGLFALITALRAEGRLRTWLTRYGGVWSLVGLVGSALLALWWWRSVPEALRGLTRGEMPIATMITGWLPLLAGLLALLLVVFTLLSPRRLHPVPVALILVAGLGLMGAEEWVREAVRKPWVVQGYMYSSGFTADEVPALREAGLVASARWIDPGAVGDERALGEEVFRVACANCHARTGYNGLAQRVRHWDEDYTAAWVQRMEHSRRQMPPWVGTPGEARALAVWLKSLPRAAAPAAPPAGTEVFARYCGGCHTLDGTRALREMVEGLSTADLDEYLQSMESDVMPPFGGSEAERRALAAWLEQVGAGTETVAAVAEGGAR